MTALPELPPEEIMREMARLALEQATTYFAEMAETMAAASNELTGPQALLAFAAAIRNTNAKTWPVKDMAS